jgi:hypothetical protein
MVSSPSGDTLRRCKNFRYIMRLKPPLRQPAFRAFVPKAGISFSQTGVSASEAHFGPVNDPASKCKRPSDAGLPRAQGHFVFAFYFVFAFFVVVPTFVLGPFDDDSDIIGQGNGSV